MSQIDDPIEAVKQQYPEEPTGPLSVMLDVLSVLHPFAGVGNVFRQFTSQAEQRARVKALFESLEWYVQEHEKKIEELELEKQLQRTEAKEAVIAAVTAALLSPDLNKIKRFAAILGHEFIGKGGQKDWENAAAYIRELTQLGDDDIRVLRILHELQRTAFIGQDQKPDQPQFAGTMERALIRAEGQGMSRDDVYSRCARLNGIWSYATNGTASRNGCRGLCLSID
jgi:hypothetical protein